MRPLPRFSPFVSLALLLLAVPFPATARILSYAPLTDRHAIPALQHRMNRHFILMEFTGAGGVPFDCRILCPPLPPSMGQLVLYDSKGEEEPRVLLPRSGEDVLLSMEESSAHSLR